MKRRAAVFLRDENLSMTMKVISIMSQNGTVYIEVAMFLDCESGALIIQTQIPMTLRQAAPSRCNFKA